NPESVPTNGSADQSPSHLTALLSLLTGRDKRTRSLSHQVHMTAEVLDIQDLDGVGPVTANKLREAGYDSISSLAITPILELVEKADLETSVAQKISRPASA